MKDGLSIDEAGSKFWYLNGEQHREDGPAVEYANGYKGWYLHGKHCTEEEFILKTSKFWQQVSS